MPFLIRIENGRKQRCDLWGDFSLGILLESVQSLKYVPTNVCYTIIRRVIHSNACYSGEGIDDSLVYNMHLSLRYVAQFPRPDPIC